MTTNVSVVLCTFNGAAYLRDQLRSIAEQTLPPAELVIGDDCSTDETIEILEEFRERSAFPVVVHRNSETLGVARNFFDALTRSVSEYVVFSDQDDYWYKEKIQLLHNALSATEGALCAFCDADVVDEQLRGIEGVGSLWDTLGFDDHERELMRADPLSVLVRHQVVTGAAMIVRRDFALKCGVAPQGWLHDGWIAFCAAASGRTEPLSQRLMAYRQHASNNVGALRDGFAAKVAKLYRKTQRVVLAARYARWHSAVEADGVLYQLPESIRNRLERRLVHLRCRIDLPGSRARRIAPIAMEYMRGGYREHSVGWPAAIQDLLSPASPE